MSDFRLDENMLETSKGLQSVTKFENKAEQHINLKVHGQDGNEIHFKIKRSMPLKKLMHTYCKKTGLTMTYVRFRFDGEPVNEIDSPEKLQMEDGDAIEVFMEQIAGCNSSGIIFRYSGLFYTKQICTFLES